MPGGVVRVKRMRPMPPALLASTLGACLIVTSLPEPAFDYLPAEPVEQFKTKSGVTEAYSWRGSYFNELPKIQTEMRQHGYRAKMCLNPYQCWTLFTRDDGSKIRVASGRWMRGTPHGGLDVRDHQYISAEVEDSASLQRFWLNLRSRISSLR